MIAVAAAVGEQIFAPPTVRPRSSPYYILNDRQD